MAKEYRDSVPREAAKKDRQLGFVERLVQQSIGDGRSFGADDDPARERWPAIWQFLSQVYVGRDRLRTPGRLTIQLGPGGVLVTLTDPDLSAALGASCANLGDALDAIETAAADPKAPWRSFGKKEPHLRKRKSES